MDQLTVFDVGDKGEAEIQGSSQAAVLGTGTHGGAIH